MAGVLKPELTHGVLTAVFLTEVLNELAEPGAGDSREDCI